MKTEKWWIVDAKDKTLGRLASEIAKRLRGKYRADFAPHVNHGEHVIVVNAEQLKVTGRKAQDKLYYRHSGYMGSLKTTNFADMQATHPGRVLEKAVKGMLPRGPLGYQLFTQLRVYTGNEHPHTAQQPEALDIKEAE